MTWTRTMPSHAALVAAALFATCAMAQGEYKTVKIDGDHYRAGVKFRTSVKVGETATARLYIVATDGWHINEKFPYQVTVTAPDGVSVTAKTLKKADAVTFSSSKVVFKIKAKPIAAGKHDIKAKVSLGVCKKEQCVLHTETLSWTVEGTGGK